MTSLNSGVVESQKELATIRMSIKDASIRKRGIKANYDEARRHGDTRLAEELKVAFRADALELQCLSSMEAETIKQLDYYQSGIRLLNRQARNIKTLKINGQISKHFKKMNLFSNNPQLIRMQQKFSQDIAIASNMAKVQQDAASVAQEASAEIQNEATADPAFDEAIERELNGPLDGIHIPHSSASSSIVDMPDNSLCMPEVCIDDMGARISTELL